jgi:aminopeptidase N
MQTAFSLDSLRTSHPIEVPVRNALEVDQIFDSISYLKGSSVIRMLASHLGVETFLHGVGDYLQAHKYQNATTSDLWSALSKASGKDVNTFMDPWIRKIGFPVVTVTEESGKVSIKQSRFLSGGEVKPEEDETTWWIPLGLKSGSKAQSNSLTAKEDTIHEIDDSFYKFNAEQTGFYRTNLPSKRLTQLSTQLDKLSPQDKIGLIGDAAALAISGDATTAGVLSFLEGFTQETNYLVWSEVLSSLGNIRSVFADDEQVSEGLRQFSLRLVDQATRKIGWEFAPNEDYLTGQLRALLLSSAGLSGHEGVIAEAKKRFTAYTEGGDKKAIHPSLRLATFKIAVKEGGKPAYDAVMKEYVKTTSVDGKEIALQSLGRVQSAELAKEYLKWSFSGAVATQDVHTPSRALALNSKTKLVVWEFIKENWDMLRERLGNNMVVLERYLRMSLNRYSSFELEKEIAAFFKDKDNSGYDRGLAVVSDTIKGRARYAQHDVEVIREWLSAHKYIK